MSEKSFSRSDQLQRLASPQCAGAILIALGLDSKLTQCGCKACILGLQGGSKLVPIWMTNLDGHPSLGGFQHLSRYILGYNIVPIHLNLDGLFEPLMGS